MEKIKYKACGVSYVLGRPSDYVWRVWADGNNAQDLLLSVSDTEKLHVQGCMFVTHSGLAKIKTLALQAGITTRRLPGELK